VTIVTFFREQKQLILPHEKQTLFRKKMKNLILKSAVLLPALIFFDYLVMMILGCTTCLFGFTKNFYDCTYCAIGKFLLAFSLLVFVVVIFKDVKSVLQQIKLN